MTSPLMRIGSNPVSQKDINITHFEGSIPWRKSVILTKLYYLLKYVKYKSLPYRWLFYEYSAVYC